VAKKSRNQGFFERLKHTCPGIFDCPGAFAKLIGYFIFFAGDSDRSKMELNEALSQRHLARWFFYILIFGFLWLTLYVGFYTFLKHEYFEKPTTFSVHANTELVQVSTQQVPMSRWYLDSVLVAASCPEDEGEKLEFHRFTGSIQLNAGVKIKFVRVGQGLLTVSLLKNNEDEPSPSRVGELFDEEDDLYKELGDCAVLEYDLGHKPEQIDSIVLPITGEIIAGREIRFTTQSKIPILLEGQVTILDRAIWTDENYNVGPYDLEPGDSFIVHDPIVASQGFVLVNDERAMTLVYRAQGLRGAIKRYQAEDYQIKNSFWSKLYHDDGLAITWIFILILFSFIRVYLRYLVN
jgi:hypothetical protein